MISGKNVSFGFDESLLLKEINFTIGENKKIGIVGRNGCGKTTLLKLINKEMPTTSGFINVEGEKVGYIPQELNLPDMIVGKFVEDILDNEWEKYKIDTLVNQLKFNNFDEYQEIRIMSEGQKMKLKLIEKLMQEPTILLIDEPTNHLDIEGITWFENYVKNLKMAVVMISHDRSFLNHTVDEIWEIENGDLRFYKGDYDNYKQEKLRLINKWDDEYVRFLKKKAQLEKLIENVGKIRDGKKRGRAVGSAKKRFEREVTNQEKGKYTIKTISNIEFNTETRASKLMLRFTNVSKNYGSKSVFKDMSFEVRGSEKVWLYGANGSGKTTAIKLIVGEESPTGGEIRVGNNIRIGYFAQKQSVLNFESTLLDQFIADTGCYFEQAFGYLQKFLFSKDDLGKRVKHLSPGERARFAFAIFAYNDYDMLVLDEPANHLDIETKEVIEKSLSEYKGTIFLVSHDRYFIEMCGINRVLQLKNS